MDKKNVLDFGPLGVGTWYLGDNQETRSEEIAAIQYALDHDVRVIDTAEMYGNGRSENLVGEAIAPYTREELYLISKVLPNNANRKNLETSLDRSLKALGTDYLDLYLYHWRGAIPLQETVTELERMKEKGKINAWGVSNFDLEDMEELANCEGGHHCMTNEVLYHLGSRGIEVALKPYLDSKEMTTIAYCPLAQAGSLKSELLNHPDVKAIASELEISVYQVLLCFTLAQFNMLSIPRTSKVAHMKELVDCLDITLSVEQLQRLNHAFPVPDHRVPLDIE